MSRGPLLKVDGARKLRRELKAAGDDLGDLKAAHTRIATTVVTAADPVVPRRTGALASSLRGSGTASASIVRAGGARVPYAGPVHWGWPARNIRPNPFLAEAAERTEPEWTAQYTDAVQDICDRHAEAADGRD